MGDAYAILDAAGATAGSSSAAGGSSEPPRKIQRRGEPIASDPSGILSIQDIIRAETVPKKKKPAGPKRVNFPTGADLLRKQGFKVPREILNIVSDESVNPALVMQIASDFGRAAQNQQQQQQQLTSARYTLPNRPVRKFIRREFRLRPDLCLQRWLREDKPDEYAFARLNIPPGVLEYSDAEYEQVILAHSDGVGEDWTKAATDELIRMLNLYHFRWHAVQDNWDADVYGPKTTEDLRERYYDVHNQLEKHRAAVENREPKYVGYDAEHERRRKEQLEALWNRTPEQVEEEKMLRAELKKIETRRREREQKARKIQEQAAKLDRQAINTAELARQHHRGRPGTSRKSTIGPQAASQAGAGQISQTPSAKEGSKKGGSSSGTAKGKAGGGGGATGSMKKAAAGGGELRTKKNGSVTSESTTATTTATSKKTITKKTTKTAKLRIAAAGGKGGSSFDAVDLVSGNKTATPLTSSMMTGSSMWFGANHDEQQQQQHDRDATLPAEIGNIKFADVKPATNTSMRNISRLPNSLGTKKADALAAMLDAEILWLAPSYLLPTSSDRTVAVYNRLRNILIAIYEHKQLFMNEVYDTAQLVSEVQQEIGEQVFESSTSSTATVTTWDEQIHEWTEVVERKLTPATLAEIPPSQQQNRRFMDAIDTEKHYPTQRQRKAAIEQQKMMKTLKQQNRTSAG